ncbi:MAG: YihY/virulence factor BrkB family protein [Weeksellaceae bacterium]|nr:YihY/virulence factor BrkB family protein [Weeksellaceae bacterium]
MTILEKLKKFFRINQLVAWLRSIQIPTLGGVDLYILLVIYTTGLVRGAITTRAAASSWSLFLSLFPFCLFVYSWMPYLPNFNEIEASLYTYLVDRIFPQTEAGAIESYVSIIARRQSNSWFTILFAILFATNGINSLMTGFVNTTRRIAGVKERNIINQYLVSLVFTVVFTLGGLAFLLFINYMVGPGTQFIEAFISESFISSTLIIVSLTAITFVAFSIGISFLYFYGVKFDGRLRKMLPGAVMSSLLFFIATLGFSFYMENFNSYNLLYGSISTLLAVMIYLYIIVSIILLGFELNMTLLYAKSRRDIILRKMRPKIILEAGEILEEEL